MDKVSDYFNMINFDSNQDLLGDNDFICPSPLLEVGSTNSKKSKSPLPKLSGKVVGAKQIYNEYLKK